MSVNLTGEKYSMMAHKDLKDLERSERSETKMAALGRDDKRLDPSTRVLTVLEPVLATGNPGSKIVPQYGSSKITVFVWGKNIILKFLGNTK